MYTLKLTEKDVETISFVGCRYSWSTALLSLEVGINHISEPEAWEIAEAFDADDARFPLLDSQSDLFQKLLDFWDEII